MRVCFVKSGDREWISYPMQYASLSSFLKQKNHEIYFYDASLRKESPEQVLNNINLDGFDVLGISVYTGSQNWIKQFIYLVKQQFQNVKIIVGGPHISSLGTDAVEHIDADIGIAGEGELPLAELLDRIEKNQKFDDIPGLIWKEDNIWKHTLNLPFYRITDLDTLPFPDYDLIRPDNYFNIFRGATVPRKKERCAVIFTSRGCPYACTFCATNCTWSRKITYYSAKRVVDEIELLKNKYNIEEIWISDDNFTFSKKRTIDICKLILEKQLNIYFRLPNGIRIETIDNEVASWMRKAGCYMVGIGVETGSETMMKNIKKNLDLKIIKEKIKILQKNKILVSGFFIYGFPNETYEQLLETKNFILKTGFDRMQISIFNPYPGSEEFDKIFLKDNFNDYKIKIKEYLYEEKLQDFLKNLNIEIIYKEAKETYFKFYTQPMVLFSLLVNINWQQIKDILRHPIFKSLFRKKHNIKDTYVKLNP